MKSLIILKIDKGFKMETITQNKESTLVMTSVIPFDMQVFHLKSIVIVIKLIDI